MNDRLSSGGRAALGICFSFVACGVFACSSDTAPSTAAPPSTTAPLDPADGLGGAGGSSAETPGGAGDGPASGGAGEGQPSLPLEPDRDDPGNGAAPVADAAAPGDEAARPDAGQNEPLPPLPGWDLNGIVGTGQSLSVGEQARDVASTTQAFGNLMLRLPANPLPLNPGADGFGLVPLVEPLRAFANTYPSAYPANIYGETPHTTMANQISSLARSELEWAAGRGFEVRQNERRVPIQSVEIAGDSVVITCAEDIGAGYTVG